MTCLSPANSRLLDLLLPVLVVVWRVIIGCYGGKTSISKSCYQRFRFEFSRLSALIEAEISSSFHRILKPVGDIVTRLYRRVSLSCFASSLVSLFCKKVWAENPAKMIATTMVNSNNVCIWNRNRFFIAEKISNKTSVAMLIQVAQTATLNS